MGDGRSIRLACWWSSWFLCAFFCDVTCLAAPLTSAEFLSLARRCASSISPSVLEMVGRTESDFDPLALRNNTEHVSVSPASLPASVGEAQQWIAKGDSVDLGLMQINSRNLAALGLTIETALDPCRSLDGGARILSAAYAQGSSSADREAALLIALSRYNTGRSLAGLVNGYVGRVLEAKNHMEPALPQAEATSEAKPSDWDIWAIASAARHRGAVWLLGSQDTQDFLIGAGAQPARGEPHGSYQGPDTAPSIQF